MDRIQRLAVMACGAALALAASSARAEQTPKYTNAEVVKVRAQERLLVIKNADGVQQTLKLADRIDGLGELRPGDHVILTLRGEPGRVESVSKSEASSARATSQPPPLFARHTVPAATSTSPGHAAIAPVQVSATSHTPADARHVVVLGRNASVGQLTLPLQVSATSQTPADARHTVPVATRASAGHAALVPPQTS